MTSAKVAERPLPERSADLDNSELEETIWIERLSLPRDHPQCAYENIGVDYGDVILIDGAPTADNGVGGLSLNNFLFLWPKQHSNFVSHTLCQVRHPLIRFS